MKFFLNEKRALLKTFAVAFQQSIIAPVWRRKWQPILVFLPGEFHGQRSLVGCCPWGCTESDTAEATQHACIHWRRKWQPTPVFLPGKSQGWRSLVGCHLWGHTELDTTEASQQQQHSPLQTQIKILCPNLTQMVASIAPVSTFLKQWTLIN